MRNILVASFLSILPVFASAQYDVKPILAHKQKMDSEITKRNQLLDDIGIPRNASTQDTAILMSINYSELIIENSLDMLANFLLAINNTEKERDKSASKKLIEDYRRSAITVCTIAVMDMATANMATENLKIKRQVEIQVENSRMACDMLGGVIRGKKIITLY